MGNAAGHHGGEGSGGSGTMHPIGEGAGHRRRNSIAQVMMPSSTWESDVQSGSRSSPQLTLSDLDGVVDEDIVYIKEVYENDDPDDLGGLKMKEFCEAFNIPPNSFAHKLICKLSDRDTKRVSLETLIRLLARARSGHELKFLFYMFDVDPKGLLDVHDLRKCMQDCVKHLKYLGGGKDENGESKVVRHALIKQTGDAVGRLLAMEEEGADMSYRDFTGFVYDYESAFGPAFDMWKALSPYSGSCRKVLEVIGYRHLGGGHTASSQDADPGARRSSHSGVREQLSPLATPEHEAVLSGAPVAPPGGRARQGLAGGGGLRRTSSEDLTGQLRKS